MPCNKTIFFISTDKPAAEVLRYYCTLAHWKPYLFASILKQNIHKSFLSDMTCVQGCQRSARSDQQEMSVPQPDVSLDLDRKYRLEKQIGRGGFGTVYSALRNFLVVS